MKLSSVLCLGAAGLACAVSLPAGAASADSAAPAATSAKPPLTVAQAATPAVLQTDAPGARVPGTDNGYPDVNPVYPFKAGRMVCGSSRKPLDIKVEGSNDSTVLLTWNRKHYLLKREPTSTGAYHFDDAKAGFVLIQIPTKSMLFDKKHMMRLADDCVPLP